MYCAALCWSKPYQVRRGRNTKVFLPCFLPTCCSDNYQSFFAPSQQPFPCMADSLHGSGHCAATSLRQLFLDEVIKIRECNILQSAGVWGKTPFSTGDSSQFCRIHYIPESVELCKQLSGPRGIAKPENNL